MTSLEALRSDFERRTNRSLSMPLAGMLVWAAIGILGILLPMRTSLVAMMAATGAIFPIALLLSRIRREELVSSTNPLAQLMGMCVLMVNLLWIVHLSLFFGAPQYVPLSLGIGLGLHWIVYSWIVKHPVGVVHAILRTALILAAWMLFPEHRVSAVAAAVVVAYAVSLAQMSTRQVSQLTA